MSRFLTADDFNQHVGKTFTPKGQHRSLTLVSVRTNPRLAWEGMPREPFSLILSGPPNDVLPEGQYDGFIEEGLEFTLYIIPVQTMSRDRQDYQVVFN